MDDRSKILFSIREFFFVFVLQCLQREMLTIEIEDGSEAP